MAVEFLLYDAPGVLFYKGDVPSAADLPADTDVIMGDVYRIAGSSTVACYLPNGKVMFDMLGGAIVPSMTTAELQEAAAAGTLQPGAFVYVSDAMVAYATLPGAYVVVQQDGTPAQLVAETELEEHRQTDLARWQDVANIRQQLLDVQAQISNKVLDQTQRIDIEAQAQADGYTVVSTLGGRVSFSATSLLISVGILYVNGTKVWSSAGLSLSIGPITDSYDVQLNDVVTCAGMETVTFTPYIAASA
jgi:hypothetical protein